MSESHLEFLERVFVSLKKCFGAKRVKDYDVADFNKIGELLAEVERLYKALPDLDEGETPARSRPLCAETTVAKRSNMP